MKAGRNDPCPCGSGKKYKQCCLATASGLRGQDLQQALAQLREPLRARARALYGEAVFEAGWRAFSQWGATAVARDPDAYRPAFEAWVAYTWLPDDALLVGQRFAREAEDHALGVDLLRQSDAELSPLQRAVAGAAVGAAYSFYEVLEGAAGEPVPLRNLYTGQTLAVADAGAPAGAVLYTAALVVNGVGALLGAMPQALDAAARETVEAHRQKWSAELGGAIDERQLYLHDSELRRLYFLLLGRVQQGSLH